MFQLHRFKAHSTKICLNCKEKHHNSICEKGSNSSMFLTTHSNSVTYPVLVTEVEGIKCRTLIDIAARCSYASSSLINEVNEKP